ncbi:MAG: FAD-dependent oxidoreductase [Desulfobacterales bacterium]|nr:FAD-dependent oxidoreductase [Desulfobacterales bacterium]
MESEQYHIISGKEKDVRLESRVLEERIQAAVEQGHRHIEVHAFGQHGIGGRLWKAGSEKVHVRVTGHTGQRLGSMGFPGTRIEAMGPASDDVGWLNAGAQIIVRGNAGNGVANAMAQGKVYIAGNIGARGMTMTKHNPKHAPPELWVLGSAGDYFGEFMAGGIAVICGIDGQSPDNILGYRPLVGMVGGRVFFRGRHGGYSKSDAKLMPIDDADWKWLEENLKKFLEAIHRIELYDELSIRDRWELIAARAPHDKVIRRIRSLPEFHDAVWNRELGKGGLVGDLSDADMNKIPIITTGEFRRYVPVWANRKYKAPCETACPSGIPVQDRWRLIREGRVDEAVDLALAYTPFPATVCGYLCPNLCMTACTRQTAMMPSVDITQLGKASVKAKLPKMPEVSGKKIAVIGGGPAGISVAWQLRHRGHEAVIYDASEDLGGKVISVIPETRIPKDVIAEELKRIKQIIPHVHLQQKLTKDDIEQLKTDFDFVVIATGARQSRTLPVPGKEKMITAFDFLKRAKIGGIDPGRNVVIIGAGNVGCDVATEARRLGAKQLTLIDVQKPAAFGKEKSHAEAAGAKFRWPCFTKEITDKGVVLDTGEVIAADTVVISIGDMPELDFLPDTVKTGKGFILVNEVYRTTDHKIFAVGDTVKPGLLTDAIGAGRKAAAVISDILEGKRPSGKVQSGQGRQESSEGRVSEYQGVHAGVWDDRKVIDKGRVKLEYFDPRITEFHDVHECGTECLSCGACRDCGICVAVCPQAAISRKSLENNGYEYVVAPDRCIGCGFCGGACPCGVWDLVENEPMNV